MLSRREQTRSTASDKRCALSLASLLLSGFWLTFSPCFSFTWLLSCVLFVPSIKSHLFICFFYAVFVIVSIRSTFNLLHSEDGRFRLIPCFIWLFVAFGLALNGRLLMAEANMADVSLSLIEYSSPCMN